MRPDTGANPPTVAQNLGCVLIVCTGNQCRSPMAAAFLDRLLSERGVATRIRSAGFVSEGARCPSEVERVMAPLGYDLSSHRSRVVRDGMLQDAELVIGMTRQHVVDLSLGAPDAFERSFTLAELVRLGEAEGPRGPNEGIAPWVVRVGAARTRAGLLSLPLSEDVPDPIGKPFGAYLETRDRLSLLCSRLADLLAPV